MDDTPVLTKVLGTLLLVFLFVFTLFVISGSIEYEIMITR